ncbi:MAG TPA: hypothetical protein VNA66_08580, partial [Gammaproteobacteria bacterium]|nr:hypothetical protein [Gammaproteobacteria bacterium]
MRWLKRGALALFALVFVALAGVGAVFWAVGTESGTVWLIGRLVAAAPQISIERVRGSLLGGVRLENVSMRTPRDELDIDSLTLEWNAPALLTGVLAFRHADATRAAYRRVPDVPSGGGGPPKLPWPLRIDEGSVSELSITIQDTTLTFTSNTLAGTYYDAHLELTDVAGTFGDTALAADATIDLADDIEITLTSQWSGPLAGVAASGSFTLSGTWPELTVNHELITPFAATTTGTLVAGPFSVDVVNTWQNLAWPSVAGVASPSGRLALAGSLDDYRYEGTGTVDVLDRDASFTVAGTGQRLLLALEQLELVPAAPGRGSLTAGGNVDLEGRDTSLDLAARGFDPAWIVAAWPGRLDGTAQLRAGLEPEPNVTLAGLALGGELRGYPVTLGGAATLTDSDRVRLDMLR